MLEIGFYLWSAACLVLFAGISWLVTGLLHLSGVGEMVVRTILMGLALSVFGLVHWFRGRRQQTGRPPEQAASDFPADRELESYIREADARLSASKLGKEAQLRQLPAIFLIGESGSAKTSLFVHSGLEPDLLAGQVYQDHNIICTRPVNLWLARDTLFVESGGALLLDPARWVRLLKHFRSTGHKVFGSEQAARGILVCVDCESLLRNGEEALAAMARNLHARLGEVSDVLGIRLPVYVLFSKPDRVPCFAEFAGSLTDDELHRVWGVTLQMRGQREQGGVYAEEEARRLSAAFDGLFRALADKRPLFLARENDRAKLPAIYEFPREFRKLQNALVRFLVDLGRPSQLRVNHFVRGFYFSGVRPVTVREMEPLVPVAAASEGSEATGFFESLAAPGATGGPLPGAAVKTHRVPQWLFLGRLFTEVLLRDRAAMGASSKSIRSQMARRIAALGATVLLLAWTVGMTVSYFRNRALAARVTEAAAGIAQSEAGGAAQELPSLAALERLDQLRDSVELLSFYERQGAPWSLRWGLYVGSDLYPAARRLYFSRFSQLLFGATQRSLLEWLLKLPPRPGPNDEYKSSYDTLKADLITTSHHEKSDRTFLSPLLAERWAAGRPIDSDRTQLARRQFDFYADELAISNPFSTVNDVDAVEHARDYLAQFNAAESVYQFIVAEAARQRPAVNFNRQFPGSAAYVVNNRDVPGAFSLEGWRFVEQAIGSVSRFFGGERWVLGDRAVTALDPSKLGPELRDRYHRDYIGNWRAYLSNSSVVAYRSVTDAAQKLTQLSGNQSYLLGLFCLASIHTAVPSGDISAVFQPVQYVTPPNCADRYIQDHNGAYATALAALEVSMDRASKSGAAPAEELISQTMADAANGYKATRQIAQNFQIDREGNVHGMVQKLMEDPIRSAEGMLNRLGPAQINAEARRFCGDFAELAGKYPFNTNSKIDAGLEDLDAIFRPQDGKLAKFYQSTLHNYLDRNGADFTRKPDSRVQITDAFLRFWTRSAAFSDALYKNSTREPSLAYSMRALPAEGLHSTTLNLDGQTLKSGGSGGESRDFTWPGTAAHGAKLAGSLGGPDLSFITYEGLWAAFRFFGDADRFQASGASYTLQWVPRQGQSNQPIRLDSGKALSLPYQLDLKGAPPVFQKGYLSGFQCVAEAAR